MSKKYSWVVDAFDSEILGFSCAKIQHIDKDSVPHLIDNLIQEKISYATIRIPSNDYSLINELERNGFYMVDIFIEMECMLTSENTSQRPIIRKASMSDLQDLQKISGESFTSTRYFNDPFISIVSAKKIYKKWIENSLNKSVADLVLVWEENEAICGFITLQKNGHIPLIAVDRKFRGRGIGKKLIFESFKKFNDWNITKLKIETQLQNIPAIRSYQACGFKITDSYITLAWNKEVNFLNKKNDRN